MFIELASGIWKHVSKAQRPVCWTFFEVHPFFALIETYYIFHRMRREALFQATADASALSLQSPTVFGLIYNRLPAQPRPHSQLQQTHHWASAVFTPSTDFSPSLNRAHDLNRLFGCPQLCSWPQQTSCPASPHSWPQQTPPVLVHIHGLNWLPAWHQPHSWHQQSPYLLLI